MSGEQRVEVAVVGAGQAGLSTSYWLAERDIDHVLLERDRSGNSWRDRWDSFCLVTPNWTLDLPGFPYDGDDPDGFIPRDAIADYVLRYREFLDAPVQESTEVLSLSRSDDRWIVTTDGGKWSARAVVVATGAFPFPSIPPMAKSIHPDLLQLHSQKYRRPSALPEGGVLVVGSGQSGAQIVDDLVIEGREVWFSIGQSGRGPRRYRGKDISVWLREVGFADMPVTDEMRHRPRPNPIVSGRDGGKDLNLRAFGRDGVHLVGRVLEADQSTLRFSDDVDDVVAGADEVATQMQDLVDRHIAEHGIEAPPADVETINWTPGATPTQLDLKSLGVTSVVWATGYHYDFSWIDADIFDNRGYPHQQRGVTSEEGLYFIGLHGMHTVGSGLFSGVGADAQHVVNHISDTLETAPSHLERVIHR
jgi:putative flavoprotein involved in K+ transport